MGRPRKNVVIETGADAPVSPFNLKTFIKKLSKDKPDAEVQLLGEASTESSSFSVPWWIPSGLMGLDYVLGKGIPGGRIIEVFSNNPSEGKTSIVALLSGAVQKAGGIVLLIDTESGAMIDRMTTLGIDINDLVVSQPENMEQVFDVIHTFIEEVRKDGFIGPVVACWDSVAATPTRTQLEATYEKEQYAPQARVLSSGLRKLMPILRENNATLLCANQVREAIGVAFGETKQTVGGMGLRFYSHIRLGLSRTTTLKDANNSPIGITILAKAKKNKLTRPFKETSINLMFDNGFDYIGSEFTYAYERGFIVDNGKGYYSFSDCMDKKFRESAYPEYRTEAFIEKLKKSIQE